jgi:hypothetical protein
MSIKLGPYLALRPFKKFISEQSAGSLSHYRGRILSHAKEPRSGDEAFHGTGGRSYTWSVRFFSNLEQTHPSVACFLQTPVRVWSFHLSAACTPSQSPFQG